MYIHTWDVSKGRLTHHASPLYKYPVASGGVCPVFSGFEPGLWSRSG